jgi:NADH-quinone oxidoreductase subunit E
MLTEEERRDIDRLITRYPDPRAASVEALKVVQQHRGWIPDGALAEVAERLGMSEAALDGVATFYSLLFRRPVGDHVVLVCDSVSCWLTGSDRIVEEFRDRYHAGLGQTTPDNRFTLLPIPCLGACDGAPAMMVDDDLHLNVDPERLDEILAGYPARHREPQ